MLSKTLISNFVYCRQTSIPMCLFVALGASGHKHADLATAKVLRGTCPDMCPEKERYVREDRRRLAVYEILPGTDLVGTAHILLIYSVCVMKR